MAKASLTRVGNAADSPQGFLKPSPAAGHEAEFLEGYDADLGYDAEQWPYQPPQGQINSDLSQGRWEGEAGLYPSPPW